MFELLSEARMKVQRLRWGRGGACPCCSQFCKVYRRKLNSAMAYGLIWLYKVQRAHGFIDYVHVPSKATRRVVRSAGEFARLELWGFVRQKVNEDTHKRCSGYWRITRTGRAFVRRERRASSHVYIYNGQVLPESAIPHWVVERDGKPPVISIEDALGRHFNYRDLMGDGRLRSET